jgi:hypothetical protein
MAVAGDEADLVAEPEAVGGGRDGEPAVLVGGALVSRGGLVADERRARIEGERLETGARRYSVDHPYRSLGLPVRRSRHRSPARPPGY